MSFGLPPGFQEQRIIHENAARAAERYHAMRRGTEDAPGRKASADGRALHAAPGLIGALRAALYRALANVRAPRSDGRPRSLDAGPTFAWDDAHRLTDISCSLPDGASGVVALVTEDGRQWTAVCVRSPWVPG